jgi:putative inorganic carbon (HCO3(-)) transporter
MKMKASFFANGRIPYLGVFAGLIFGLAILLFPSPAVFKAFLPAMGVLVILNNVFIGILLLPLVLPFLSNEIFTLFLVLVLGAFGLHLFVNREEKQMELTLNPYLYLFLTLLFFSGLSSVTLGYSLREVILHLLGWGLVLALRNSLLTREKSKLFLLSLILASFLVSLYGIYGYWLGVPGESGWVDAAMHPEISTRAFSTFGNPNVLAEYLIFTIPFTLALLWYQRGWFERLLLGAVALVQVLCLVLTLSRSGWVAFAFSLAVFALLLDRRLVWAGAGVGVLLLPFLLQIDLLWVRFISIFSLKDSSNAHRIVVWRETLGMIGEFWVTGVGLGHRAFRVVYPSFAFDRSKFPFHSHNTYLQLAVETGIFGLLAFILLLGSTAKGAVRQFFRSRNRFTRCLLAAGISSLAGVLVFGLFESVLYLPKIIIMFWLLLGLIGTVLPLDPYSDDLAPPQME